MRKLYFAALAVALAACAQFPAKHADEPALAFADLPYESAQGYAWPVTRVALPTINTRYGLPAETSVAYVEMNAKGTKTLVFIHGLGSYLKFWQAQLDAFAKAGYRVVAIDMLGYGKSDKPASFPYTMEAMADVVHALVGQLGIERPTLVGHSMGGQTALSYAIRYPGELSALVLTSPAGFEAFSAREKTWFKSVITTAGIRSADETAIWGSVRRANFHQWNEDLEWLVAERVRLAKAPDFPAYAYAQVKSIHGLLETDFIRASLDHINVPTLIVYGDKDRLIPNPFLHPGATRDIMDFGRDHIYGSTLVGLPGCGHTVQLDCAADYNAEVSKFLMRQ